MEDFRKGDQQEIFSKKIRAGKRTYFFDVKSTKGNDYFITITESKKRFDDGSFVKHKIFLYKEDFNKFMFPFGSSLYANNASFICGINFCTYIMYF